MPCAAVSPVVLGRGAVVAGLDVGELTGVVSLAAAPADLALVGAVADAEILERGQQPALQRLPQVQLYGDPATEPVFDVLAVGAFQYWWAFDGPDNLAKGLCLCAIHHKLLDKGVLELTVDRTIAVSPRFVGRSEASCAMVLSLTGRPAREPQHGMDAVESDHIGW